jgi:hypothetical protein
MASQKTCHFGRRFKRNASRHGSHQRPTWIEDRDERQAVRCPQRGAGRTEAENARADTVWYGRILCFLFVWRQKLLGSQTMAISQGWSWQAACRCVCVCLCMCEIESCIMWLTYILHTLYILYIHTYIILSHSQGSEALYPNRVSAIWI